ncbi:MAG: glycosyltransferase family 2 protein [Chloroflexia bacterium]|nr:glycosyltransferase family 2 protein [Chloroflexia bacterium]
MNAPGAERAGPGRLPGSLSLVLPAHNEAGNIEAVVSRALAVLPDYTSDFEIVVVNDGSRDETPQIIDRLAAEDARVRTVHHPANQGYGAALRSGFAVTRGDHVMFMDADRQFDIADIRLLVPFVEFFDIVAGFRLERNDPLRRRINAEIFNVAIRLLFGVHLRDIDCAFKIFRGDLLRSLELTAPGALINTEIQAKLRRQGASLEQVGVHHYPRIAGEATGGSARVIFRAMGETVLLWLRMHRYQPPASATKPRPYHSLGDIVMGTGTAVGAFLLRRLWRRK